MSTILSSTMAAKVTAARRAKVLSLAALVSLSGLIPRGAWADETAKAGDSLDRENCATYDRIAEERCADQCYNVIGAMLELPTENAPQQPNASPEELANAPFPRT
jgi:hypothetical protein